MMIYAVSMMKMMIMMMVMMIMKVKKNDDRRAIDERSTSDRSTSAIRSQYERRSSVRESQKKYFENISNMCTEWLKGSDRERSRALAVSTHRLNASDRERSRSLLIQPTG